MFCETTVHTRKRAKKTAANGYIFEYYFMHKGKRYSKSGFDSEKMAKETGERHLKSLRGDIFNGIPNLDDSIPTVKEAYEEFMDICSTKYQANTLYNMKKDSRYFLSTFGDLRVDTIDYRFLQRYFNSRSMCGIETNKNIQKVLKRIFKYLVRTGVLSKNPMDDVTVTGSENSRIKDNDILQKEDFDILIDKLMSRDTWLSHAYAVSMQISYYTGLRLSEVFALHWDDIDMDHRTINAQHKLVYKGQTSGTRYRTNKMKSKKSHAVLPFPEVLLEPLRIWRAKNPNEIVISTAKGDYCNPDSAGNVLRNAAKEVGMKFNFHMLRHTYSTNLVMGGVDLKTAQELMRHSNINTTMSIYTHVESIRKREAVDSVFR